MLIAFELIPVSGWDLLQNVVDVDSITLLPFALLFLVTLSDAGEITKTKRVTYKTRRKLNP